MARFYQPDPVLPSRRSATCFRAATIFLKVDQTLDWYVTRARDGPWCRKSVFSVLAAPPRGGRPPGCTSSRLLYFLSFRILITRSSFSLIASTTANCRVNGSRGLGIGLGFLSTSVASRLPFIIWCSICRQTLPSGPILMEPAYLAAILHDDVVLRAAISRR